MIKLVLLTGLGSFIGGILRVFISFILNIKFDKTLQFPIGIMAVNIIGCFLIGIFFAYFKEKPQFGELQYFLMTGILGGFTTFSTFSLEALQLFQNNEPIKAIFYVLGSVLLGIMACFLGSKIHF
ncbi:fluoride efflux transporter CrcB [Capnocytophaga cynodegmi]|uniref:fluoride efflux transporter CrcB n=1 Tax=Capnocytophaga cynodegmi TaxID=28189 RepID=UPI001AD4740D|nr:fluoride efflux transporter CrcB [Capnocytophaga cynodegmi]GIM53877.1 putative fluoride ion transporter CrcB [Capnocytophaga cynodegmi]